MGQSCTKHRSVANGPRTGAGPNQNGKGDKRNKNKNPTAPSTLPSGGYGVRPSTGMSHTSRGLGHSSFDEGDSTSRGLNGSFNTVEGAGSNFAGEVASTHRSTKSSKATKAYMRQQRLDQQVQECLDEIPVITLIATTAVGGQGPTETPVGAPPASAASGAQQGRPPLTNNNQVSRPTLQPPPHQQRAPGNRGSAPNSPGVPTQPSSPRQRGPVAHLTQKSLHQQPKQQQQQQQQPRQQTMHVPQPRVPGNTHVDRFRQAGLVVQAVQAMSPQRQPQEQTTRPVDTTGEAKLQRLVNSKSLLDFRTLEQEEATDRKFREANQLRILTSMFEQSQSEIEEVLDQQKLHRMREQRYGFTSSGNSSPAGSGNNRLKSQMLVGETPSPRRAPPPPPGPTLRPASSPNTNEGRVRLPLRRPLDPVKPIPGSGRSRTGSPSRSPPTTTIVKDPPSDWERAERREEEEEEPRASAWHRQGQRFKEEQRRGVESSEVSKRQSVLHMESIDHAEIVQKFSASAIDFGASVTRRIHEQKKMMGEAKDKYHFASSEDRGSRGGSFTSRAAPHRLAPPPPSSSVHARNDPTWLESHNSNNNTSTGFSGGAHLSRHDDSTFASSVGGNTSTWGSAAKKPRRAAPTPAADPFSSHYQAEGSATRPTGAAYRR